MNWYKRSSQEFQIQITERHNQEYSFEVSISVDDDFNVISAYGYTDDMPNIPRHWVGAPMNNPIFTNLTPEFLGDNLEDIRSQVSRANALEQESE
jgi:hypothetical protein